MLSAQDISGFSSNCFPQGKSVFGAVSFRQADLQPFDTHHAWVSKVNSDSPSW